MRIQWFLRNFFALLLFSGIAHSGDINFKSGSWSGQVNNENTGCIMVSPFSDNQASLVVEMISEHDINIGIYWHNESFDALLGAPISGRLVIDRQPPVNLTGNFVRKNYLSFGSKNVGLLKHLFTAGSQGRLEYGDEGWATFGLNGTSKAVDRLHSCWKERLAKSQLTPEPQPVANKTMNVFLNENDEEKTASLSATECSLEESAECISHSVSCSKAGELTIYITGDEDPQLLLNNISSIATGDFKDAFVDIFLDDGRVKIQMPVWDISLLYNDMNGAWDLELKAGSSDVDNFFNSVNSNQRGDSYFTINRSKYTLSHLSSGGEVLAKFKDACMRYRAS